MLLLFSTMVAEKHLFGKELFIQVTVRVFPERLSICVCLSFPFAFFKVKLWHFIVLIPNLCLSIYFSNNVDYMNSLHRQISVNCS